MAIDVLLISWAVVTVLAFIDLVIPDPLPFIDEIILFIISMILLGALAIRGAGDALSAAWFYIGHPLTLTFLLTTGLLYFIDRKRKKKTNKKVKK